VVCEGREALFDQSSHSGDKYYEFLIIMSFFLMRLMKINVKSYLKSLVSNSKISLNMAIYYMPAVGRQVLH
jgi:uncharacterized MnhB-related membrane protein